MKQHYILILRFYFKNSTENFSNYEDIQIHKIKGESLHEQELELHSSFKCYVKLNKIFSRNLN